MRHAHHTITLTTPDDLAGKLRENFPRADVAAIEAYLSAFRAYERGATTAALTRLATAAQRIATPTVDLDQP
jgi:hypothetical protein